MTIRMTNIPISDENYIDDLRQLTNIVKGGGSYCQDQMI
jgi:hypothetical protein